ncbi:MAG: DNA polymerase III subunit delta [Mycoplasmatales bacterium]|nr:DNA polymerase III subunit delta [Mycoplasmatales bacterium]
MKFIYGQEWFLIDQEVKRLIREFDKEVITYSDGEPLDDILLDASTASMFSEGKILIIKNHPALIKKDKDTENFIESVKNNHDTLIIFTFETEKLDRQNQLVKYLLKYGEPKEFKSLEEKNVIYTIKQIVKDKGGTIDNLAAIKLSNKLPSDLRLIVNEIEKLLFENNNITAKMIDTSIGEYVKDDYFALSNALTARDSHGVISAYKAKKIAGEDVTKMISQIASSLSLALKVYAYRKQGFNNQAIAEKTKIHIYRIKKAGEILATSNSLDIRELIINLAKLEGDIKTGKIEASNGIEVFLLKLIK